jgi:hypothetical protein
MHIESGLFTHMVLQRNRKNVSEAAFTGTCAAASGPVLATVRRGKNTLKGFSSLSVGKISRGKFTGCLKGLPVGGPYDIELKAGAEVLAVKDMLVGDVWLLGGQSNMQGCGLIPKNNTPANPQVRAFYMDDRWAVAKDPIHNMWECVDQVHIDLAGGIRPAKPAADWGVCPGPAFAADLLKRTGVPQGLIACAHGGTSMTQWDPKRKNEGGKSLYGALVRRLVKNGGRVAGMIWYQGCSDANGDAAPLYTKRMQELIAALRRDAGDKALPVAIVQIARVIGWAPEIAVPWNSIQEQERLLPKVIKNLATVPAIDLPLDDLIHISGEGHMVLGARLAQAMQALRGDRKAGPLPLQLKKVSVESVRGLGVAVAEFDNVVGKLQSGGRPSGFSIVSATGSANHFDITLDGTRVRIRSTQNTDFLNEAVLYYGYGTDPYCNITDAAGRSLPVLGPIRLGVPRAVTPFAQSLRVSAFQPSAAKLEALAFPEALETLGLATRTFAGPFCDLHNEIARHDGKDELVYFACRFSCSEAMTLALVLGYDGPLKAWVDGKALFHDPNGVNPATTEKAKVKFQAKAGDHEVVLALGTNNGLAWGVHLRLERLDVPAKLLLKGPPQYAMPVLVG